MNFWWFAAIVGVIALIAAVILNQYAFDIFKILFIALVLSGLFAWGSVRIAGFFIYYYVNRALHSGRTLTRSLAPVTGIEHQLSQTELHRITTILRRSLSDMWMLDSPMDEAKIRRGLTSISSNCSEITHFELERINWLFERGKKKLRKTRFALMTTLIFSGFIAGCFIGIYLQHWYHFLK